MERIVILGSTGSIGRQVMEVIRKKRKNFQIFGLAVKSNADLLSSQIKEFGAKEVVLAEKEAAEKITKKFPKVNVHFGTEALSQLVCHPKVDTVVFASSGIIAMKPLIEAIQKRKKILLANKESLVAGGEIINRYLDLYKGEILPLDSEHSAIFQCLRGEKKEEIRNLILTCSGGPLKNHSLQDLSKVTTKEVLSHPVWKMGPKVTVDSATLMNKGFEVLEAHYLFRIPLEKIKIIIHPESIIHSMVEFQDGNIKALLSIPDMRIPLQYALFYPQRTCGFLETLDLIKINKLSFFNADTKRFPCLNFAYKVGGIGGTMPAALVFSDEILVNKFLNKEIGFLDIPKIINKILKLHQSITKPSIEDIFQLQKWVERKINELI